MFRHLSSLLCGLLIAVLLATCAKKPTRRPIDGQRRVRVDAEVRFAKALERMCAAKGYLGCTGTLIPADGRPISRAFGVVEKGGSPIRSDAKMLVASVGKTFAATVVLRLVEQGRLKLDQKVSELLADLAWVKKIANYEHLTVRMLLGHTSGLPDYIPVKGFAATVINEPNKVWKPKDRLAFIFNKSPISAPGSAFSYAGSNYILLGVIIEKVAGQTYYNLANKLILAPQSLSATKPAIDRELAGLVPGHIHPKNGLGLKPGSVVQDRRLVFNPQVEWTTGGFVSNTADLARWARALYGGRVVKPKTLKLMVTAAGNNNAGHGLGVIVRGNGTWRAHGSAGYIPGYLTQIWYYPNKRTAIAIQANTDYPPMTAADIDRIVKASLR